MVTLKDIAKATGFGLSTVSLVLSNRGEQVRIKQETSDKIFAAATKLGYCRNELAAEIRSGRSRTLAMLIPDVTSDFFAEAMLRASNIASRAGFFTKFFFFHPTDQPENLLTQVISQRPAAILTFNDLGPRFDLIYAYVERYKIPTAALDFESPQADFNILTDDKHGITQTIDYLVNNGHQRIAHLTTILKAQFARKRHDYYCDIMAKYNLTPEVTIIDSTASDHREQLLTYVDQFVQRLNRPTAITCSNDFQAITLFTALLAAGVKIPQDVSIVGYGGLKLTEICSPRIATVVQPWDKLAETAIDVILKKISGQEQQRQFFLPTYLNPAETISPRR